MGMIDRKTYNEYRMERQENSCDSSQRLDLILCSGTLQRAGVLGR
jgi:hypothetical protein